MFISKNKCSNSNFKILFVSSFFIILEKVYISNITLSNYHSIVNVPRGEASPPSWGGQIEKKKFGGAKIRKNNKFWGKILIFFKFLNF
jgi:hypothetical protein